MLKKLPQLNVAFLGLQVHAAGNEPKVARVVAHHRHRLGTDTDEFAGLLRSDLLSQFHAVYV